MNTIVFALILVALAVCLVVIARAAYIMIADSIKEAAYREGYNDAARTAYYYAVNGDIPVSISGSKGEFVTTRYAEISHAMVNLHEEEKAAYNKKIAAVSDDFLCTNCGAQARKSQTDGEFCSYDCVAAYRYHNNNAWGR